MKLNLLIAVSLVTLGACSKSPPADPVPPPTAPAAQAVDVPAGAYTLDRAHASLLFKVSHLGFSQYTSKFKTFDAQLQFDPTNFAASSVTATIDPRSLDLDNPPAGFVDELIGKNWLDSEQFPVITFKSTKVDSLAPNKARITGDFTLHGVTKPVALEATFNGGYASHPYEQNARIGFSATGSFKRSDFGVSYGIPEPGTTMGVSDEVNVVIEAEFSGPPAANGASPSATPAAPTPQETK